MLAGNPKTFFSINWIIYRRHIVNIVFTCKQPLRFLHPCLTQTGTAHWSQGQLRSRLFHEEDPRPNYWQIEQAHRSGCLKQHMGKDGGGGKIILLKVFSTIYTRLKGLVNCGQRIGLLSLSEPICRQLGSILARKTAVQITAHLRKDPFQPFKPRNYQFSPLWCIQLPPLL